MLRLASAALGAAFSCLPLCNALAADAPETFEELFAPITHGDCVKMSAVRLVGAAVTLTPEQFQFVRAFWMATPPVAKELPPGDKAFLARDPKGEAVMGLYDDDGQVCVVMRSPDWLEKLIDAVGRGETGKRGAPL